MKYILFITLLFQLSCEKSKKESAELEETRKYLEANREYEMIKGCKVIARTRIFETWIVIAFDPASELLRDNRTYLTIPDPLARSVVFGDIKAVKCLLDKDHDPNVRSNPHGSSAVKHNSVLFWAVFKNFPEIVTLLIEAGADVHEKNEDGDFVLLRTADFLEHTEVAKILKSYGAK